MLSDLRRETRRNTADKVFDGVPAGATEADLFRSFLAAHDFAPPTLKAFILDTSESVR